ncbi:MAG: VWA domain-containing protein [Actinomycetota bacterium]|nr:VWA domain-containing protein [Actinomycetota bacterium]
MTRRDLNRIAGPRRRLIWLALVVVVVASVPAEAFAAPESVNVRRVDTDSFPEVSVQISLGTSQPLSADDVTLTENGVTPGRVDVRPIDEEIATVDVVLVIDTSGSMKGEPMSAAIAAAKSFVNELPPDIRVGLVSFSDRPRVLQRLSGERTGLLEAIDTLKADGETALYDAVNEAASLFTGTGQRNIVLLSDGGDTASKSSLRSAASTNASVFAVGLKSGEFDEKALQRIALATDGDYSPVASADLSRLYKGLATELSNQYVLTYESEILSGGEATVFVSAFGQTDSILTLLPPAPVDAPSEAEGPARETPSQPLLNGAAGLWVSLGLLFVACFWILAMVFGGRYQHDRDQELARLMDMTGGDRPAETTRSRSDRRLRWIPQTLIRAVHGLADRRGVGEALDLKIERAGLPLSPEEFLAMTVVTAFGGAVLGLVVFGNLLVALAVACATSMIPNFLLTMLARRRFNRLHGQLPDILMILASSIRSGHSFLQALDMVSKETGEPGATEFARLVAEIRLGRPIEEAMTAMSVRVGSEDFRWAVMAVNIQREVGGNLAELLDGVADTLRDRESLRRQVDVLSSEGRISIGILTVLPIAVALYLMRVNPEYVGLLFNTSIGMLLVAGATTLLIAGYVWMKRMVKIDV